MNTKTFLIAVGALAVAAAVAWAAPADTPFNPMTATRACMPASGEATILADISSNSSFAQLTPYKVYRLICSGDAFYEFGDGAAPTADSSSNYLPADAVEYFLSGGTGQSDYLSAVSTTAAADICYLLLCE